MTAWLESWAKFMADLSWIWNQSMRITRNISMFPDSFFLGKTDTSHGMISDIFSVNCNFDFTPKEKFSEHAQSSGLRDQS